MSPKFFVLGFINLGASIKRQIANFQFVAPLMAFFNPSLNDTSTVHYFGDGEYLSTHISLIFFESRLLDLTICGFDAVVIIDDEVSSGLLNWRRMFHGSYL